MVIFRSSITTHLQNIEESKAEVQAFRQEICE